MTINESHLREEYSIEDMEYLDQPEAESIYSIKADIIQTNNYVGLVDVGCRLGTIRNHLTHDYHYLGFDTSLEPIAFARARNKNQKHRFKTSSWNSPPKAMFSVDCILFSSVLVYNSNPTEMFERICDFYGTKAALVQEVTADNDADLNYTDLSYFFDNYKCNTVDLDLNIPCGKRKIIHVEYQKL